MNHPFSRARWIWTAEEGNPRYAVRLFRGTFELADAQQVLCHVSADSRYILFIDGRQIGRGPSRSDLRHYVYDTYPIDLDTGTHVFAALVLAYSGDASPIAEMHERGAFVLEAHTPDGQIVCATGDEGQWRVQSDTAYSCSPVREENTYFAIGSAEIVDGSAVPQGWEQVAFSDSHWEQPRVIATPVLREQPHDLADNGGRWRLVPRNLPHPAEELCDFAEAPDFPVTIAPQSRHEILLDAGEYANGFPVVSLEDGRGSTITLHYAEALSHNGKKGVRDDRQGTDVVGFYDTYKPGGAAETYTPLHWRAFRFIKLVVETADAPLTLHECQYAATGYPWDRLAAFHVTDGPPELPAVLDTDFRTLSRCTVETFMDCPYYEQLQYIGDTRLQALVSYVTTGDTRLGARAVQQFHWSRNAEGLTQSRYPSRIEQIIPPFSLLWILMVEDLWRYAPEEENTVAECLAGCRAVLEWFGKHLTPEGVLGGSLPWWNFVDWVPGWKNGVPPPASDGEPCATLNLQYLAALQAYIRLEEGLGDTREAEFWQAHVDMLIDAITLTFWDSDSRLLCEGTDDRYGYTQHAQAWGLLTDIIPADAIEDVVDSLHTDETLAQATYYQTFYIVEALAKVGRLEELWSKWLAPWRDALALNLTTWPEQPEPTRSDCHAWSAWPTYAFLTHVLGVQPSESGFAAVALIPNYVQGWNKLSGNVPTPAGILRVTADWSDSQTVKMTQFLDEEM